VLPLRAHVVQPHRPRPHRSGTATYATRKGACTQQPRVHLRQKSNDQDHGTRQKHIMHEEAEENGTARREDRCTSQAPCTQITSYILGVGLTSTLSPTDTSLTDTHQHLPAYHTMCVDMTTREDVSTQSGAVDGCLGQVQGRRGCSTLHQGANRRQSVRRGGEEGGKTAAGS